MCILYFRQNAYLTLISDITVFHSAQQCPVRLQDINYCPKTCFCLKILFGMETSKLTWRWSNHCWSHGEGQSGDVDQNQKTVPSTTATSAIQHVEDGQLQLLGSSQTNMSFWRFRMGLYTAVDEYMFLCILAQLCYRTVRRRADHAQRETLTSRKATPQCLPGKNRIYELLFRT